MPDIILTDDLPPVFQGGQAPEYLHPGMFDHEGVWGSNSMLKYASDVAGSTWAKLNAAHEFRVNRVDEGPRHTAKLKQMVDGIDREFAPAWDRVRAELKSERNRVESELAKAANLKANPDYRNAVLGVYSGSKPEERAASIEQAIAEGDGPTLATLLEAPAIVTGLSAEQKAAIKYRLYERANPSAHALLKQLEKVLPRVEQASIAYHSAAVRLRQGTDRFDKKVERAKQLEAQLAGTVH